MKRRFTTLLCGLFSLMLFVMAGCQSVGGVDVNKALTNGLSVQSYEGKQTVSIDFTLDDKAAELPPELSLLKNVTLAFSSVKMQDRTHSSFEGELRYSKGTVPFKASTNGQQIALLVEGAKKPVLLDLSAGSLLSANGGAGAAAGSLPLDFSTIGDPNKLIQNVVPLLVKYLPNPKTVKVDSVKEAVNGETLDLKKIHTEVKGSEAAGLIKELVANLLADEKGLNELTTVVLQQIMGEQYNPLFSGVAAGVVKEKLQELSANLDKTLAEEPFKQLLTDATGLKVDLYLDGASNVRKTGFELVLATGDSSLKSIKIQGSAEFWKINQPVTASLVNTTGALEAGPGKPASLAHFLKTLDPNSQAYKLLVNDLKVTRKHISMPLADGLPGEEVRPYIDPESESTLVPVRFVSEQLDAEVSWDGDKQQATVVDILSGKTLVFTIGSKTVLVDGQPVELEATAALTGGSTYVPVRFIAENFGAKVGWDADTRTVSIIRD